MLNNIEKSNKIKICSFYIRRKYINKNDFNNEININHEKVDYVNESMSPRQILIAYANKLLEERKSIINYFSEHLESLIDFIYGIKSSKIIFDEIKHIRTVDELAFKRLVYQILLYYKITSSKIEYYYNKISHRDSQENIDMRKFLIKIWSPNKELMINYLKELQQNLEENSETYKKYERYIFLLERDKTIFEKLHKVQKIWIKNHINFNPTSLTFFTMNELPYPDCFLKRINKTRALITLNIPDIGKLKFITKYSQEWYGDISKYKDELILKSDNSMISQKYYGLEFLDSNHIRIIIFNFPPNTKFKYPTRFEVKEIFENIINE